MSPTTVLHVLGGGVVAGGNERTALALAQRLSPQRFRSVLVALAPERDAFAAEFERARIPVHHLPYQRGDGFRFSRAFKELARREGASGLICYTFGRPHLWVHAGARRAGIRRRLTRVSGWPVEPDVGAFKRLQWASRWVCPLEVANSEYVAQRLRSLGGYPARRIQVIPNGIDLHGRPQATHSDRRAGLEAVMTARLDPAKDHLTLLHAWTRVPEARLTLIGDGPLRPELEAAGARLRLGSRIQFAGTRIDVPDWLARADLFILSTRTEGSPNALLEAMAAGLPCIATDIPPVREVLGEAGVLVPPGDDVALADAVAAVSADPPLRRRLGQAARERVEEKFDLQAAVRAYEVLLGA